MAQPISADSADSTVSAVKGTQTGVGPTGPAVEGDSAAGFGVYGHSQSGRGVVAHSDTSYGVRASSGSSSAIRASSVSGAGIEGETTSGTVGVIGSSPPGVGVKGVSTSGTGVAGESATGVGVSGHGTTGGYFEGSFEGIHVVGHDPVAAGVAGYNDNSGPGVYGKSTNGAAGYFDGNVVVTGDVQLTGADYAEDFDIADPQGVEPGTVMVLDDSGGVRISQQAYDRRVAGIVSGAGTFKPAVILDRHSTGSDRRALALMGKVYCMVDATHGPIAVGDLLTTSSTPGHAMKAQDPDRAFGAVIGKALKPWSNGCGLVPVLVALQ